MKGNCVHLLFRMALCDIHSFAFVHSFVPRTRLMLGAEKVGRRKQNQRGPRSQEGDSLVGKTSLSHKSRCAGRARCHAGQGQRARSSEPSTDPGLGVGLKLEPRMDPEAGPGGSEARNSVHRAQDTRLISQDKTKSLGICPDRDGADGSRQGPRRADQHQDRRLRGRTCSPLGEQDLQKPVPGGVGCPGPGGPPVGLGPSTLGIRASLGCRQGLCSPRSRTSPPIPRPALHPSALSLISGPS